jgi:hypothetical protein
MQSSVIIAENFVKSILSKFFILSLYGLLKFSNFCKLIFDNIFLFLGKNGKLVIFC